MEGVILEREIIKEPKIPKDANPVFGSPIAPIDRLTIMDDVSFEELVAEWAHGYLKKNEVSVYRLGGSGDKGRDICVEYRDGSTDIYQCKHYDKPLTPSQYVIEFGKLVYYTWVPDGFKVPKNYYIVASKGIGTKLSDLIHDSEELRNYIVEEWDSKCKNTITKNQEITLTGSLLEHLQKFDFSIIKSVSPQDLIEQYRQTPYFKFRFGGGISKRPTITPPTVIPSEVDIPYVKSLMVVYSEILNRPIGTLSNFLEEESKYSKHFMRERKAYYIADSLRRFLRDEYINDCVFEKFENEIADGIMDTFEEDYDNKFNRVKEVTKVARSLNIVSPDIPEILPSDQSGTCHILVEKGVIKWDE